MPAIGENIRRARKALGWTQEDLARKLGYKSKSSIQKIEKGITDIAQSRIVDFATALGTTPARLLGLVDEETSAKTDAIANAVVRMRSDANFHKAVMILLKEEDNKNLCTMIDVLELMQKRQNR